MINGVIDDEMEWGREWECEMIDSGWREGRERERRMRLWLFVSLSCCEWSFEWD